MRFRSLRVRLHKWRQWRTYLLVVLFAYGLTLSVGNLMAPFRVNLENLVFDQYQRWLPRPYDFDQPVRIVDIDDESIRHIGRWPWPRQTMAELVEALTKAGAAAVAFDVLFSEKDKPTDEEKACLQRVIRTADQAARCQERADGDIAFGHAIEGRPVALGTFFTTTPNAVKAELPAKAGMSYVGDDPAKFLNRLNGALIPIPVLAEAARGLGYLNWLPDDDRVVRRVPLILNINGQVEPSLSMEALRVAQGASAYVIKSTNTFGETSGKSARVEAVEVGEVIVPLQADGELRVWFANSDPRRSIPAWKALDSEIGRASCRERVWR